MRKKYPIKEDQLFEISKRKGIFPYDFFTGPEKFECEELPPAKHFKNTLNNEDLDEMEPSQEVLEARRDEAVKVFNAVGCKNLKDYLKFYQFLDVILLAVGFVNFRNEMYNDFRIGPARMITGPSLALASAMYNAVQFNIAHPEKRMTTAFELIDNATFISSWGSRRTGYNTEY